MLEELPETLDETYERILRNINKANRDHAYRLLQCLTVAVRPLRVAELAEVLAVDFGTTSHGGTAKLNTGWRWEDQQQAVLSTCSSLISIVDVTTYQGPRQVVQFSHFSVKEFLTSSRLARSSGDVSRFYIYLEPAHTTLAQACLGVLLQLDEYVPMEWYKLEKSFPLSLYAAEHWADHARFENVSSQMREGMRYLFDPDKPYFASWLQVRNVAKTLDLSRYFSSSTWSPKRTPLYYAALCGFHDLAEHLIINHPHQVNADDGHFGSPLCAALEREHFDIAQLLRQHNAEVDIRDSQTLLHAATSRGHSKIVEWLLSHGANSDYWCDEPRPLRVAVRSGHLEISRILLQHKADHSALDKDGQTVLHLAFVEGHINVARLLLEHGVDVNAQDWNRSTVLHLASERGHIIFVRLLLEHGVDVNARDRNNSTALHRASGQGHIDIARLLLEHGINVNHQNGAHSTALHRALEQGHVDVARLLLEHGVDVNTRDWNRSTVLHVASRQGHIDIARQLLEYGVNVNAQDKDRSTALHLASKEGHVNVVRVLLEHRADVNARDNNHCTALRVASEWIYDSTRLVRDIARLKLEVGRLLLEHGADLDAKDNKGRTAFQVASEDVYYDLAKLLSK
jgi:ankyrin repeat protein